MNNDSMVNDSKSDSNVVEFLATICSTPNENHVPSRCPKTTKAPADGKKVANFLTIENYRISSLIIRYGSICTIRIKGMNLLYKSSDTIGYKWNQTLHFLGVH